MLVECMESMPGMDDSWRSKGVATDAAIISGLAPGSEAVIVMVGYSTFGKSLTGRDRYANTPKKSTVSASSRLATGRRMKTAQGFTVDPREQPRP